MGGIIFLIAAVVTALFYVMEEEKIRSLLSDSRTSQSQYQILRKELSMDEKKEFEAYIAVDEDSKLSDTEKAERR